MTKPIILCVDDEKTILDSLEAQLQSEFGSEFTIEIAESGEEGLDILEQARTDQVEVPVILADYLMPGMKGDQFFIHAHDKIPETRNIMLTGQAGLEAVISAINHAALYRYIGKPWEKSDLLVTVKEAIASFRQQQTIKSQNSSLQLLNNQLQQMNQHLEEQVAERTQDLNRQKELFQQIFDNSPDGMVMFDETERIFKANAAFGVIFESPLSELKGKLLRDIIELSDPPEASAKAFQMVLAGQSLHQETKCRKKRDGQQIPVSLTAYPLAYDGNRRGGILICRDLTSQWEAADLLQRSYERRRHSYFFNDLAVSKKGIRNETYIQAQLLGISLKNPFMLFFLAVTTEKERVNQLDWEKETEARMLVDRMIDWLSGKTEVNAWESHGGIGIMYTLPENHQRDVTAEKQIAVNLLEKICSHFPQAIVTLGIAESQSGMDNFAEHFQQARIAVLIGSKIRPGLNIHHYWDIGAFPLLARLIDDEESQRFLDRTIGKLIKHDNATGTDLFHTLEKIISHQSLQAVADEMFLHYKTILFRKQSIEKILGVSLDSFEGRTMIDTAMTLYYFQEMKDKI